MRVDPVIPVVGVLLLGPDITYVIPGHINNLWSPEPDGFPPLNPPFLLNGLNYNKVLLTGINIIHLYLDPIQ
jgi:hypothetical protein